MLRKTVGMWLAIILFISGSVLAAPVRKEKAEKAFRGWIRTNSIKMGRDLGRKDISDTKTYPDSGNRVLFYVISFSEGGYAVISAEDRIEPIIAFSDSGTFPQDALDPLRIMLDADLTDRYEECDAQDLKKASGKRSKADRKQLKTAAHFQKKAVRWNKLIETADTDFGIEEAGSRSSVDDIRVDVLVSTRWNQRSPENAYVPNSYPCGCVATAMSQLMRYHSHPVLGIGANSNSIQVDEVSQTATTRGGDGIGGPYNWSGMPDYPDSSHLQVGALCFDSGVSVGMSYESSGSGVDTLKSASAFMNWFDYTTAKKHYAGSGTASDTIIHNAINANLDAAFPVLLGITGNGGHAVVCDGYGFHGSIPYHHINMGWAGSSDAWYNLPDISSFDRVYKVIYNVFPNDGGGIIAGRVMGSDGYPIGDVLVEADNGAQTYTVTANSKGIYSLAHVPQGSYTVSVSDPELTSDILTASIGNTTIIDQCPNAWGVDLTVSDTILTADADAAVHAAAAGSNFGTDEALAVQDDSMGNVSETFIKFDLSDITYAADHAQLRLLVNSNADTGVGELHLVTDDAWLETGITYNNRPVDTVRIAEITPTVIPDTMEVTTLISGALNNGNLDDDSVVTDASSGNTWSTRVADSKYYIPADPTGSGYFTGWTLSRIGTYPGGNNTIGMLTYAHPTCFDSGTTPDFCAFANSGGVQMESDPIPTALAGGSTVAATFKVSTLTSPGTFEATASFIFDKGLDTERIVTAAPTATESLALVTFDGDKTAYAGTYSATATVPADCTTVAVVAGALNTTSSIGVSLDDIELGYSSTGISLSDRLLCIDVSDTVVQELAGDGVITFCLRGVPGLVEYASRETSDAPKLVVSQQASADSTADWDADGTQPDGAWSYGYYPQYGPYSSFTLFPAWTAYYGGPQSWIGGAGQIWDHPEGYPRVGKYSASPYGYSGNHTIDTTAKIESVRRWTSNIKGVISIINDVQQIQNSADDNIVRIRKNGTVVWSHDLGENYRAMHSLELTVYPGDVIDFAVDPIGSHSADWIYWRARITTLPCTANRSGLVAHYDFDEASDMPTDADGDQYDRKMFAFDYSGKNNHATLMNTDTWTVWNAGMIGNAIDLDGADDYVQTPAVLNPSTTAFTAAAWVKGGSANRTVLSQTGGQNWLMIDDSGKLATGIRPAGGMALATPETWDASSWHHVAFVWDGTYRRLYIDGEEAASDSVAAPVAAGGTLTVGADSALANCFDGMIDDLGIWTRDLTASELYSMYVSGAAGRNLAHVKSYSPAFMDADSDGDGLPNSWELDYFGGITNAVPSGDPDNDLRDNISEYAFGGNPTNRLDAGTVPQLQQDASNMEFIYLLRDDPALTATTLTRTNLMSGTWEVHTVQPGADEAGDTFTFYTNSMPAGDQERFIKLRIE